MIRAARAAISEKTRIDQRLLVRVKRSAEAATRRDAETKKTEEAAKRQAVEARKAEAEAKRKADEAARRAREEKAVAERARPAAPKPAAKPKADVKKPVLPALRGVSQVAAPRPAPQPASPPVPRIVVSEAPAVVRTVEAEPANSQTSGRGGWKSVRRDPARALAQAKAKAKPANRADAIDLAQAAQAAIERFIAERGVTKNKSSGIQAVISVCRPGAISSCVTRPAGPSTSVIASKANPSSLPLRKPAASR